MSRFPLDQIKKILVIRTSAIGDVIQTLPALTVLRKNFPQAHISWIVEPLSYDIVRDHPYLNEVIKVDLKSIVEKLKKPATFSQGLEEIKKLAQRLREEQYDLVLDLHGLLKSGLISHFTKAPIRLVYCKSREGSSFFATHRAPANPASRHAVQKYLDAVRFLGLPVEEGDDHQFIMAILPEDEEFAANFLASQGVKEGDLLIGLNPGASWPTKQWPIHSFAALGNLLREKYQCKIIIFGGPKDLPMVKSIAAQMKNQAIIAAGKTSLKQLAALIKRCQVFAGNDTGPLHLAVAVKTPVVAIFGPSDYVYTGPYGPNKIVVSKNLACAPCFKVKQCPKKKGLECLETIQPQEVLEAIEKFL